MPHVSQLVTTHCIVTVVHACSSAGWTLQSFNTTAIFPDLKYDTQPFYYCHLFRDDKGLPYSQASHENYEM
jgi:hypothetical protein